MLGSPKLTLEKVKHQETNLHLPTLKQFPHQIIINQIKNNKLTTSTSSNHQQHQLHLPQTRSAPANFGVPLPPPHHVKLEQTLLSWRLRATIYVWTRANEKLTPFSLAHQTLFFARPFVSPPYTHTLFLFSARPTLLHDNCERFLSLVGLCHSTDISSLTFLLKQRAFWDNATQTIRSWTFNTVVVLSYVCSLLMNNGQMFVYVKIDGANSGGSIKWMTIYLCNPSI